MYNDLQNLQANPQELELRAYNAAFYELGFRWYWDTPTYEALIAFSEDPVERLLHYLRREQAHLLKAYDAAFLLRVIVEKQAACRRQYSLIADLAARPVDWSQLIGRELGA
ncbi:hypothetical protein [Pelomonas sp. KK5]|uniref:hypothetical protein n=1 Tax=Pelomonas sp. KK5 TaxID=1855730 RepID=UPI00097C2B29|nr:hypothetical protein [Pelomonas sp. KK5]